MDFSLSDFGQFLDENALGLGIGGQIAGILLKNRGRKQQQNRHDEYIAAERERLARMRAEAEGAAAGVQPRFTPEEQTRLREADAARGEAALQPSFQPQYATSVAGQPEEVRTEIARRMTDAVRRGRNNAAALARVNSYNNVDLDNQIAAQRSGSDINRVGREAQASGDILRNELAYGVPRAGANLKAAGDIVGGLGSIASLYAMTRPPVRRAPMDRNYSGYGGGP